MTPKTLTKERRERFVEILSAFSDKLTRPEIEATAELLATAAASRTEREAPAFTLGCDQLSWELYNAIKDTKYISKITRIKMRDVLELHLGNEDDMKNKQWDAAHGFPAELVPIVDKLERALGLRNMMRDERAQDVYRWLIEQEKAGRTIAKFAEWASMPERAAYISKYKKNPDAIKTDWGIVFTEEVSRASIIETL